MTIISSDDRTDYELLPSLLEYISDIDADFTDIAEKRKHVLKQFASQLRSSKENGNDIDLVFICTHNSRRSHMAQLWAQAASRYYGVTGVSSYSGGTEATAFNPRSVKALKKAGFEITQLEPSDNPKYSVRYVASEPEILAFSKKFKDAFNPQKGFFAVMTCSDADEACPVVPGAAYRIAIPYEDPKIADDTPEEEKVYNERCRQIAVEMFYLFSLI